MTIGTGNTQSQTIHTPNLQALPQAQGVALRSVTKKYGSVVAVENLTLDIPAGVLLLSTWPEWLW
jgi:hypothetical protein